MNDIQLGTAAADLIIERLNNAGFQAYYVGGCVRNYLLGIEIKDYDITTSATPKEILTLFPDYKTFTNGMKHGTITVLIDQPYEITTFRKDGQYADSRHPDSVCFCSSLYEDLKRRDFTCNAMAFSKSQGIIDVFNSFYDTRNRILRAVGEPSLRFEEDALRILRGLRLSAKYNFFIHEDTAKAMHSCTRLLDKISRERVYSEISQIFEGRYMYNALVGYSDIIAQALRFEITDMSVYEQSLAASQKCEGDFYVKFPAFLYVILNGDVERAVTVASDVRCDNKLKRSIRLLFGSFDFFIERLSQFTENKRLRRYITKKLLNKTRENFEQFILFYKAVNTGDKTESIAELLKLESEDIILNNECIKVEDLTITGLDLQKIGFEGHNIADALEIVLDEVMKGELPNKPSEILAFADGLKH